MVLELTDFDADDEDYVEKMNANNSTLESFINALSAMVSATSGDGAILLQDLFDRPGLVGSHSYVLDVDAYAGGDTITIGRRPAPFTPASETDMSIAWGLYGGEWQRVVMSGDLDISAAAIVAGLPKTVYIGIPSSGTPQFYETSPTANVLMIYSMTWDGADLSDFRRVTQILPGYSMIQSIAAAPRKEATFDTETNFVDGGTYSDSSILLPGASVSNLVDIDGSVELVGFFFDVPRDDDDAFAAGGSDADVELSIVDDDDNELTESDFVIDCEDPIGFVFKGLNAGIADNKFVRTARRLRLKVTAVGADVSSARCFTWGVWVRPLIGANVSKDNTKIKQV